MSGHRTDRVGALLQAALSELLLREIKDPRIGMVTITGVKISPDLKHASVYVTSMGDAAAQTRMLAGLASARPYLQSHAGRRLGLRFTPELRFEIDPSIETAARLDRLLQSTRTSTDDESDGNA
jgi:ribosome-binding factor A